MAMLAAFMSLIVSFVREDFLLLESKEAQGFFNMQTGGPLAQPP